MNVLHFGTFDVKAGGPAMSVYLTLLGLNRCGIEASLAMYSLANSGQLIGADVPVHFCKRPWEQKMAFSPTLKKELGKIKNIDVFHAQGVWQYPTYALIDVAKQKRKPYLITPRGMLYPQDIKKSNPIFKKISLKIRLLNDLNKAACVHVTCEEEMRYCRNLGVMAPIAVIPNPVEIKDYLPLKNQDVFRVGYLGRLSPRKNVEALLYAFSELKLPNAELVVIGSGDEEYERFLHSEVERLNLKNVVFVGFLSGDDKDAVLSSLSLLVMPSEFENLGNVILEGLVRGIPCVATKGAPWKDLTDYNCGWWIDYNQDAIIKAIADAYSVEIDLRNKMGENGKHLVREKYSVESVSSKMLTLYEWVCGKSSKPKFVYE